VYDIPETIPSIGLGANGLIRKTSVDTQIRPYVDT
jgi:hypothetical protein